MTLNKSGVVCSYPWQMKELFPISTLMLLSNFLKASSSTVPLALPAITKNPSKLQLPPWLLQPQLPPWLPHSWSQATTASCCRGPLLLRPGAYYHPLGTSHCQEPGPGTSPGVQGCTSKPPSLRQPCTPLP